MTETDNRNVFKTMCRPLPDDDEFVYQINPNMLDKALAVVKTLAMNSDYDFYGASITPYKDGVILNLRISHFDSTIFTDKFFEAFKCVSGITVVPDEYYMTVKLHIKNFYYKLTDDDIPVF